MESLAAEIDSFDKYLEHTDKIESFYTKICIESSLLEIRLMEYNVAYAELIMNSDDHFDDKAEKSFLPMIKSHWEKGLFFKSSD